jgi:NAD kinase
MDRLTENKLVLVVRHTRLDELIARFNTESQARFYIEHLGGDFSDYQREHLRYQQARQQAEDILSRLGRVQVVDRGYVPNFIFGPQDTVLALGQDGLVANILKYLDDQPLLGVNPDPERWEGVLLPFAVPELGEVVPQLFAGKRQIRPVSMAQISLNTGERLRGVNDLFIGPRSHTSARYTIQTGGQSESHSSSGVIVSTGLGSTGWLRSIFAGATGIAAALSGKPPASQTAQTFAWDADYLYFSVREPWPSKTSAAQITFGKVTAETPLVLTSQMPENGVIFSDGIEADFLQFNSGTVATVTVSEQKGRLVV